VSGHEIECNTESSAYMTVVRFLGAFTKLQKGTLSFFMSVCLSVSLTARMKKKFGSHWTDFHEIYLHVSRKSVENIQVLLNDDRNNWYFTLSHMHIYNTALLSSS
jgi:hypothetical protein